MSRQPVVVVTGASKGIGLAVTCALLTNFNANVVALSRSKPAELLELSHAHPMSLLHIQCDVTDDAALREAISSAQQTYGHIDGLVLNAGTLEPLGRLSNPEIDATAWRRHFDVNFFHLVVAVQAALPFLRNSELGGRIVFVSSGLAVGGSPGCAPYNASKAAMNSLCHTLAEEEPEIVAVALRPGVVDTQMQETLRREGGANLRPEDHRRFVMAHKEGKLVKPEDCGYVIAALAIKAPKSLSGQFVKWDSDECKEFRKS